MTNAIASGLAAVLLVVIVIAVGVRWLTPAAGTRSDAPEQCLSCHDAVVGFEASHDPVRIGCAGCHLGDPRARDARVAHSGMLRIPGNLADAPRTCGSAACHPQMVARVGNSLMTTMAGVVAVDRWVFGEAPTPDGDTPIDGIGHSPADSHLRNLCASCHLGNTKAAAGSIDETSRGGGCLACHLTYSTEAVASLQRTTELRTDGFRAMTHPSLRARVDDTHCFGCHSRSGRISLNFQGLSEAPGELVRTLADGRNLQRAVPDVHAERGLGCVDCHLSWELMGDGSRPQHADAHTMVRCDDCHGGTTTVGTAQLDGDARKLLDLQGTLDPDRRFLATKKGTYALINTTVTAGTATLTPKGTTRALSLKAPAKACRSAPHKDLACATCHDAWAPTCVGCHTEYDAKGTMFDLLANAEAPGEWHETGGAMFADPATLGVRDAPEGRRVQEFIPGMVMTLARHDAERKVPAFKRLFASTFPHTIRREARSCVGCHADPVALGYGRGTLALEGRRWRFTPSRPILGDGLPDDAWIPFLATRGNDSTTRIDTRPFTVAEQQRILTVGACLTCHAGDSTVMQALLDDVEATMARRTRRCRTPSWN